ncbi:uncharacterized protein LOC144110116 [Amblyomma americanum]
MAATCNGFCLAATMDPIDISPMCFKVTVRQNYGRLVAYNSRNCHGVLLVLPGHHFALPWRMTHTEEQQEYAREESADKQGCTVIKNTDRLGKRCEDDGGARRTECEEEEPESARQGMYTGAASQSFSLLTNFMFIWRLCLST